jgi:site-specific DNA-methyltransferase (adenine-specific)
MNGGFVEGRDAGKETVEDWECADDCPIWMLDAQSGDRPGMSGGGKHRADYAGGMFGAVDSTSTARGDKGGASRFYYSAKTSREERDRGLEDFEDVAQGVGALRDGARSKTAKNGHPTLKPIDLCRYYARLLLPPPRKDGKPRRLLVPFSGAGSEMIGALQAGWDEVVGIELVPKHAEWARARIAKGKIFQNEKKR